MEKKLIRIIYTTRKGAWPIAGQAKINVYLSPRCKPKYKHIAYWHTHPSKLSRLHKKQNKWYWTAGGSFSEPDKAILSHPMQNSNGAPLFVTYRSGHSRKKRTYNTDGIKKGQHKGTTVRQTNIDKEIVTLPEGIPY